MPPLIFLSTAVSKSVTVKTPATTDEKAIKKSPAFSGPFF
jgi:hypothetical protein